MGFWKTVVRFLPSTDLDGYRSWADEDCTACDGSGQIAGLRAMPGQPGSGVAPITCSCVRINQRHAREDRKWQAAMRKQEQRQRERESRQPPQEDRTGPASSDRTGQPDPKDKVDPVIDPHLPTHQMNVYDRNFHRLMIRIAQITVCCYKWKCECDDRANWRIIDGVKKSMPRDWTRPLDGEEQLRLGVFDRNDPLAEYIMPIGELPPAEEQWYREAVSSGSITLCCLRKVCACSQGYNWRLVDGVKRSVPLDRPANWKPTPPLIVNGQPVDLRGFDPDKDQ